jgi:uncharacterized protein with PQ loop repeat
MEPKLFFQLLGGLGTTCFALSALPQAIKSWKEGHAKGISAATVWLWVIGEAAMFGYTLKVYPNDYILLINYAVNLALVSVIFRYKYWTRP